MCGYDACGCMGSHEKTNVALGRIYGTHSIGSMKAKRGASLATLYFMVVRV